jgi:hypothetical protein
MPCRSARSCHASRVFHLELRQFPHVTREFNLSREQLEARVLSRWVRGEPFETGEHTWDPQRAKLVVYEGPALAPDEIGMGRGWANVTRRGEEVTGRLLEEARGSVRSFPALDTLKRQLIELARRGPLRFDEVLALAGGLQPEAPDGQRLELAGRAIWDLLGEGRLRLSAAENDPKEEQRGSTE